MSDSQSSREKIQRPTDSTVAADGSSSDVSSSSTPPIRFPGEQPTIITNRPPITAPTGSDSAYRIMEGRIMPGDHLEHFELVEYVGGGGMGRVFRALDTSLARTVAIKILSPNQSADPETVLRFHNEAQSAARLDHENIARVYYVGEDRGIHFIVFEFVEGENIRKLVERKGVLQIDEAICYTLQVVDALAHAAARQIVHRDIKPSNLLITPHGRVKLIDMGLARLQLVDPLGADLTASGVTLGTFDYISPEQARNPRSADIRSDIYSLGCTLFFMLTGRPPFPQGTMLQKLLQHHEEPPPDIRQFRNDLPDEANRIMQKMMAKDPDHRYLDPNDLISDLMFLAEQMGLENVIPRSAYWMPRSAPKDSFVHNNLPWLASIAALICIVIGLDVYWNVTSPREQPPSTLSLTTNETGNELSVSNRKPVLPDTDAQQTVLKTSKSTPAENQGISASSKPLRKSEDNSKKMSLQELWELYPLANPAVKSKFFAAENPENDAPTISQSARNIDRLEIRDLTTDPAFPGIFSETNQTSSPIFFPDRDNVTYHESQTSSLPAASSDKTASAGKSSKHNGLLVVSNLVGGENEYTSLAAACSAARNGDVIELRYNGRREEKPIHMANLKATIRAGEGYQPIVVFQPDDTDPIKYPRSMFSLNSGRLTISNVAMEFHIPREIPTDNWSLVDIRGGQTVRFDKCVLTVTNASDQLGAYHQDAAFFRVGSSPGADITIANGTSGAPPLAKIELNDCIARGEAVFMLVEDFQPVHLAWDNGLLLTSEQLLSAAGSARSPKPDEMLRIELQHVTVVSRLGLARLVSSLSAPYQFTVQFTCNKNIIITSPGSSLIEQDVNGPLENARRQIIWNGDRNTYQDTTIFWTIRSLNSEPSSDTLSFESWRTYWGPSRENQPFSGQIGWKNYPKPDRPLHTQTPTDYLLNKQSSEQTSFGVSNDGHKNGMQHDRLISLPIDSQIEKPLPSAPR